MNAEQLQEWKELADKATPGEWNVNTANLWTDGNLVGSFYTGKDAVSDSHQYVHVMTDASAWDAAIASTDAAFIAAARTAVPALIAEVERLKGIIADAADIIDEQLHINSDEICTCDICQRAHQFVMEFKPVGAE